LVGNGFEQAKMSEIAAAAAVAKGTLYLYFPTKVALFEAVLTETIGSTLRLAGNPELGTGLSVQQFLRQMTAHAATMLSDPRRQGLFRLILTEGPRFPEILAVYRRVAFDPLMMSIKSLAERASRQGELKSDALVRQPLLLLSPALLATVWNGMFPDAALEPQQVFSDFLDLIFGAAIEGS
jgi:TetR/AcrR family transcriptional regulator, regulator of autoinduction and epiphytic fitness